MKRFVFAAAAVLLGGPALAQPQQQPPEVVQMDSAIEVAVGEAKVLRFGDAFQSAGMTSKDVADIIPQSDHMLTITGLVPGGTVLFLKDDKGRVIYTGSIIVTPSAGRLVKIYTRGKDYVSYYCSETGGCGRANLDKKLANGRDPDEPTAVTITRPTGDGGAIMRQYGPN